MHKIFEISPGQALAAFTGFVLLAAGVGFTAGIVISLVLVACYWALNEWSWRQHERKVEQERQQKLLEQEARMHALVFKHSRVLLRKRRQGSFRDEYGILNDQKWQRDLQHFVKKVLPLELDWEDLNEVFDLPTSIEEILDEIGSDADDSEELLPSLKSPQSLGLEFEHICAQALRSLGWDAKVTTASGDQGVDIEAERNGYTVVIQCKLYASPVGNSAVQQIVAGKLHYGADCGMVISKSSFTPAARQLARTTGVVLLDYDDLTMINMLLFEDGSTGHSGAELRMDQLSGDRSDAKVLSLGETDVAMRSRSQEPGLGGRFKRARPMKEIRIEPLIGRDAD